MVIKRRKHAVYNVKYLYVFRNVGKHILTKELKKRVEGFFREIAGYYDFEIEVMGNEFDHVHKFLSVLTNYSPARTVEVVEDYKFEGGF